MKNGTEEGRLPEFVRSPAGSRLLERGSDGVVWLSFEALERTGLVKHAFSTRLGGVSEGVFSAMNFSFRRGDNPAHVRENYRRMARVLDVDETRMVLSHQTHTTNVRTVTEKDAGKGVVRERDYTDVDGLITNVPGLTLVTFFADCIPLWFVDPVHRAVGLSHSGWRGTVRRMGAVTLARMASEYGTDPADVIACVGPGICGNCYEVGEEVIDRFRGAFSPCWYETLFSPKDNGRYLLDLWQANAAVLKEAGVRPENIHVTDICTRCNSGLLFSHRVQGNARGNLAAFLCLNPQGPVPEKVSG